MEFVYGSDRECSSGKDAPLAAPEAGPRGRGNHPGKRRQALCPAGPSRGGNAPDPGHRPRTRGEGILRAAAGKGAESVGGMRVLLHTHALLWWLFDDPALSKAARDAIRDPGNAVLVSAASAWGVPPTRARREVAET